MTTPGNARDQALIDAVYRRRAEQLARRPATKTASDTIPALIFSFGTERYGIELSALAEVLPYRGCTAVAGAPPALLGVMNVRGDIRPVADLRLLLELPPGEDEARGYVALVRKERHGGHAVGFRIDTIDEVRQIDSTELVAGASGAAAIRGSRLAKAITSDTVILIDTNAALAALGLVIS